MFDLQKIKNDFPIFNNYQDKPLIYLDSTATSLKPRQVIEKTNEYYEKYTANVFRGLYSLSQKATDEYESARKIVARFINAESEDEVVFVRNTTEALNLVCWGLVKNTVKQGDVIVTSILEHHSNFVPWQELSKSTKAKLVILDINNKGKLIFDTPTIHKAIKKAKVVALTHISNVTGTINPLKEIIAKIKNANPQCIVIIDGAQAAPHVKVDVRSLGCDFYAFSGHKMLGPTGIGVLWGKSQLLKETNPLLYGGEMISKVTLEGTLYKEAPHKFESGTPHIAGVIGLGAAISYLEGIGIDKIHQHEKKLVEYSLEKLSKVKNLTLYGPTDPETRAGIMTFSLSGIHPHDIAEILDRDNICIRTGHHCAMPLHIRLGLPGSARASFYLYSTEEDVDRLIEAIIKVKKVFSVD